MNDLFALLKMKDLGKLRKGVKEFLYLGYSADQLLNQFADVVLNAKEFSEMKKARMLEKIALADKGLNERADSELQTLNMFSSCFSVLTNPDFIV